MWNKYYMDLLLERSLCCRLTKTQNESQPCRTSQLGFLLQEFSRNGIPIVWLLNGEESGMRISLHSIESSLLRVNLKPMISSHNNHYLCNPTEYLHKRTCIISATPADSLITPYMNRALNQQKKKWDTK